MEKNFSFLKFFALESSVEINIFIQYNSQQDTTIYSLFWRTFVFVPLLQTQLISSVLWLWLSANTHWAPLCSMTPHTRSDRGQQPHFPFPFRKTSTPIATADQLNVPRMHLSSRLTPGVGSCQSWPQLALQLLDIDWRMWGRPLRGTLALHMGSSLCIHGG